jgi:hypothetical protein
MVLPLGQCYQTCRCRQELVCRQQDPAPFALAGSGSTVASRPKILQNNSEPAVEKNDWREKFGGRKASEFWQKRPKKKYFKENMFFPIE